MSEPEDGDFGDSPDRNRTSDMLVTAAIVLGSVAFGALLFYLAQRRPSMFMDSPAQRPLELQAPVPPNLEAKLGQIRAYLRTAGKSESAAAGLTNAAHASALLDEAESTFGAEALGRVCNVAKLRELIRKTQDRHGKMLAA